MESLSRPIHSRKLSSFSNKTQYDAVFTSGASHIDVQDYREIFSSSQPCSIPVLDVSSLGQKSDALSFNFRDSNPDYSKIFGGFRDEDVAVSYQELFGCDKARAPASTAPTSQDSDNLYRRSPDALKQFNMSYNKIHTKSKDGLDRTRHVTQLPAVTGFTCFVDEPVMEAEKSNMSAVNVSVDSPPKRSSRNAVRKESNHVESISVEDKKSKIFEDIKRHPSAVSSSSTDVNRKDVPRRSVNSEARKTDLYEEIDVNSAASAALKKAIERAQESIRIAKESVGRKKSGLRSFSNKKIKNSLKVEEQKCTDEDSSQIFHDVGRIRKSGSTVIPNFMESEKLFVAKKFIDEIHEKISESVKHSKFVDKTIAYNATEVASETESKPLDSAGKYEDATLCSEAVDTETECQTDNNIVDEYEAEIKVSKPTIDILEHQTVVKEQELEDNDNELSQDFNQNDNENRVDASLDLPENEKEKNVLEHEEVKYAESEKHENVLEHKEVKYAESEKHEEIEEASEFVESENESKHDQNSEIHKDDETSELFDGFGEINAKDSVQTCDCKLEESEANLHDNCEINQEDDRTVERKVETLDESYDQEFDEKSSSDDNVIEETVDTARVHVASNNGEMNDANLETTQDVDDVAEVSCELQAEEADFGEKDSIDQTVFDDNEDAYEVKSEESNITDNLADIGSDNYERSESSSVSTHGDKISDEESNIQPPRKETPDSEHTNEIKDFQEPESRHKDDEVEVPGPSNVSGKDLFKKIDEEAAAKQKEWEKNRLAVERAIREARERAFAEARERAERERAAVEKATEEVRQRMMAEAHEKVSKASVTNKSSSDKTSAQSKLRAERAAVERATSEARQRALEKAISQKTAYDLNRSESALRTKAKLEKHNRIMERAAKALAEKEKRDRLAQKEQAERNRLAENLDADIKRWANAKEGNLRALLSTLQYILGPESGWQPVSLTEIITTSAVKKTYRKATLCVHPDKLQQRGATIQQKYICEKVFDLLKAAWNRFNSEVR